VDFNKENNISLIDNTYHFIDLVANKRYEFTKLPRKRLSRIPKLVDLGPVDIVFQINQN
jgi:hypothetical protein